MKTHFKPLVLENFRKLFRDEASYRSFKGKLADSLRAGFSPVLADGKILGLAVSNENGKELIYQSVTEQWVKNPSSLDKLRQSLESEDLVEAQELKETASRRRRQRTATKR